MVRLVRLTCFFLVLAISVTGWAQPIHHPDEPIVAAFAGGVVTLRDFETAYARDVGGWDTARSASPAAYERFLSTYLDYRLKLKAARAAGYANQPSIQRQQRRYRLQMIRHRLRTDSVLHPAMRSLRTPLPASSSARAALRQHVERLPSTQQAEHAVWQRARTRYKVHIDTLQLLNRLGIHTLNRPSRELQTYLDPASAPRTNDDSTLTVADLATFWQTRPTLHNESLDKVLDVFLHETLLDRVSMAHMARDDALRRAVARHHDGLLLFELMQDSVWTPALSDTSAHRAYFRSHRARYIRGAASTEPTLPSAADAAMPIHPAALDTTPETASTPVNFDDVRRAVVQDYQAYRERQFVERLRNRYRAHRYPQQLRIAFQRPSSPAEQLSYEE